MLTLRLLFSFFLRTFSSWGWEWWNIICINHVVYAPYEPGLVFVFIQNIRYNDEGRAVVGDWSRLYCETSNSVTRVNDVVFPALELSLCSRKTFVFEKLNEETKGRKRSHSLYWLIPIELFFFYSPTTQSVKCRREKLRKHNSLIKLFIEFPRNAFTRSSLIFLLPLARSVIRTSRIVCCSCPVDCSQEIRNLLCSWWNNKNVYFPFIDFRAGSLARNRLENESLVNNNCGGFSLRLVLLSPWTRQLADFHHYGWK